ncbi:MAG: rRNA pseudouridine synthase [Planctomycetes bacterium]|nr:rRNA pseudouridine synthase [Planctomycetota bacterium]
MKEPIEPVQKAKRLNQYLAHAGVDSRRHCEILIQRGKVKIDGVVVRDLSARVRPGEVVTVDGQDLSSEQHVYWLLNKPQGYLCTNHDPARRPLAKDLLPHVTERIFTVGRLDEDSEGLLLLTNDGEFAQKLMHPKFGVEKTYHAQVAGLPKNEDMQKLVKGIGLVRGNSRLKKVRILKRQGESSWLEITLCEGKNREIRRMLAKLGHKVIRLKRVSIGSIRLDRLPKGKARKLKSWELSSLIKIADQTIEQE